LKARGNRAGDIVIREKPEKKKLSGAVIFSRRGRATKSRAREEIRNTSEKGIKRPIGKL